MSKSPRNPKAGPGISSNAVYSKVICAGDDPFVRKGVDEDLREILKKASQNNDYHWNNAPRNDSRTTEQFNLPKIKTPGRGLGFLRKRDDMVVRRMPREEDETSSPPKKKMSKVSLDLINHFNDFVSETGVQRASKPTQQKKSTGRVKFNTTDKAFEIDDLPADKTQKSTSGRESSLLESNAKLGSQKPLEQFSTPELVPLPTEKVTARTVETMPRFKLHNGNPPTHSSLNFDIRRKPFVLARNKKVEDKSANLMDFKKKNVRQATPKDSETLRIIDQPLEKIFADESPIAESSKFQLDTPLTYQMSDSQSPFFDLSTQQKADPKQSVGFSPVNNEASEFNFDEFNFDEFNFDFP